MSAPTPRAVVLRGLGLVLAVLVVIAVVELVRGSVTAAVTELVLAGLGALAGFLLVRRMP